MQRSSAISPAASLIDLRAGHEVRAAQPHLAPRRQPEELLRRILAEIVALDVEHARERHGARAGRRILLIVDDVERLGLPLRVILDDDAQRSEDAHHARRRPVEVLADGMLEQRDVDGVLALGDADALAEHPDRLGRVAAPAHPDNRGHPRIVPAADVAVLHEVEQLALAHAPCR